MSVFFIHSTGGAANEIKNCCKGLYTFIIFLEVSKLQVFEKVWRVVCVKSCFLSFLLIKKHHFCFSLSASLTHDCRPSTRNRQIENSTVLCSAMLPLEVEVKSSANKFPVRNLIFLLSFYTKRTIPSLQKVLYYPLNCRVVKWQSIVPFDC